MSRPLEVPIICPYCSEHDSLQFFDTRIVFDAGAQPVDIEAIYECLRCLKIAHWALIEDVSREAALAEAESRLPDARYYLRMHGNVARVHIVERTQLIPTGPMSAVAVQPHLVTFRIEEYGYWEPDRYNPPDFKRLVLHFKWERYEGHDFEVERPD
jgi:hypothetical protein